MTEVTGENLWRLRSVEDFEIVFGIRNFNHLFFYFFFFFFDSKMGRGGFFDCILRWQGYFKYTFWNKVGGEETKGSNAYLVQARILHLYLTLRGLKIGRKRLVAEDEVGRS